MQHSEREANLRILAERLEFTVEKYVYSECCFLGTDIHERQPGRTVLGPILELF
jgi:hypothetical protein